MQSSLHETPTARDTHRCYIVEMGNKFCRFQHSGMAAKGRIRTGRRNARLMIGLTTLAVRMRSDEKN